MKWQLIVGSVGIALSSVGADSVRSDTWTVPERHWPNTFMGCDFWRVLYKYGDWACWAEWASPASVTRFDNPGIYDCPAFQDVAWGSNDRIVE